jgi:hypothetical protein
VLAYHRTDLARLVATLHALPALLAQRGVLRGPVLVESAAGAAVAALLVLAWYGAGAFLGRWIGLDAGPRALVVGRACALGAGVWSLVWFALGLAGWYRADVAGVALAVGVALGVLAIIRVPGASSSSAPAPGGSTAFAWVMLAALVVSVGAAGIAALAPPTGKDALQYHLALPKAFLAAGGLVVVPYNIAGYFPLGVEMNGLGAMLLGRALSERVGEAAFGGVTFAFLPLLLAVIAGWARERGLDREAALTAAALVATVPAVYDVAGTSGYVDLALATYVVLGVRAVARWWARPAPAPAAELALALGFALAVKHLAVFSLLILGGLLLARGLRAEGEAWPAARVLAVGGAAVAAAVALASPWYLRTWLLTGSPVFPFFLDLWPGQAAGWDANRSVLIRGFNDFFGGYPKTPLDYLLAPLRVSVMGQRYVPALYEGLLGVGFLVGAPLIVWALVRRVLDVELKIVAAAAAGLALVWLFTAQVLRYLLPAVGPLALVSAAAMARAATGRWTWMLRASLLAAIAPGLLVILAWFAADGPALAVLGTESRGEYLTRRLDYFPYYRLVNETLPAQAKVWLINARRDTYHLERPYFSDYLFEDHTIRELVAQAATAAEIQDRARAAGITHVLMRQDVLLDYARSPLVDERRPERENVARLALLRAFLTERTRILEADARFVLVALPPA